MVLTLMTLVLALGSANHNPRRALNAAARGGDVRAVRRAVLANPTAAVDLNEALAHAATRSHIHVMAFLVDSGATDFDRALVQAAVRNQVRACHWLVSEERHVSAHALRAAQLAASAADATDSEWLLCSVRTTDCL